MGLPGKKSAVLDRLDVAVASVRRCAGRAAAETSRRLHAGQMSGVKERADIRVRAEGTAGFFILSKGMLTVPARLRSSETH